MVSENSFSVRVMKLPAEVIEGADTGTSRDV